MATTQGLASLLWIVILLVTFVSFYLIFTIRYGKSKRTKAPKVKVDDDDKVVVKENPLSAPLVAPATVIDVEHNPSAPRSIFGQKMTHEFVFNNVKKKSFYSVGIDGEMLKVTRVWSRLKRQLEIAYQSDAVLFRKTLATSEFTTYTKSAPLALYTHIESWAEGTRPTLWQYIKMFFWNWWLFFERNILFIINIFMLAAVIMCFYTPGSMDSATTGEDIALTSYALTTAIFICTVIAMLCHLVYLHSCGRKDTPQKTANQTMINVISCVFLLVCLCLSIYLMDIAWGDEEGKHRPKNSSLRHALNNFACYCPANDTSIYFPTYSPTFVPTSATPTQAPSLQPTLPFNLSFSPSLEPTAFPTFPNETHYDNSYSFQCTQDQHDAADNSCGYNCGVCGDTYYHPFVSYATFAGAYLLLTIFLMYETLFIGHTFFLRTLIDDNYDANTHMCVLIHGSESFGYPLFSRMTLQDLLTLEEYLSNYSEREKDRRSGDFLKHMKSVGSSIVEQTITKKASKTVDYIAKFLSFAIKLVLRFFGIPL